jgi:UDP-N-acetylmuramoyl-tripeptide--D-alanyl-D-alanine ligase
MIPMTVRELTEAVGGRLDQVPDPELVLEGPVLADSRQVLPGCLFVALPGARVDGHDFAAVAYAAGAALVLATRPVGGPAVLVDDVLDGLGRLTRAVLDRLRCGPSGLQVIGLTGSVGKTTSKDLLAALLAEAGPTIAPPGSFNNELGVPLTALRADAQTRHLLLELGARSIGHIAYLCRLAPPSIGVVLNVGAAHAGEFGSREQTARAKGELVEALGPDGVAVLNLDDPLVAGMASRSQARIVGFGRSAQAQVRAEQVRLDDRACASFRLVTPEGAADVRLRLHGEHQVGNALAAAAVAREVGLPVQRVAEVLGRQASTSRWRMEVRERPDGVLVVNDAYNANPDSVRAALRALAVIGSGRHTWAVLGEMLELGGDSVREHEAAGRLATDLGVHQVVAVGEGARPVQAGARAAGADASWVADADEAAGLLRSRLAPGDVVLVKASRSIGLDRLAALLLDG